MQYLDFHTHVTDNRPDTVSILNVMPPFDCDVLCRNGIMFTLGIHPWYIQHSWRDDICSIASVLQTNSNAVAWGEIGLDRIHETDWNLQLEVFEAQLSIADRIEKPVVIHCVKGWSELMCLKKKYKAIPSWAIHGFRGKPELARQLVDNGFYLSFGMKYNESSVKVCPTDRLFVETDESVCGIRDIYEKIAACHNTDAETLNAICKDNLDRFRIGK